VKLPPEFLITGPPEPWKPADSLVWGKLMALDLSSGWRDKLMRGIFIQHLGAERASVFFPGYPGSGPTTLARDRTAIPKDLPLLALWNALPPATRRGGLSNEWVVSGNHTETGKPILANDPHLALDAPTLWYLVRIETPHWQITGASVPGVPAVLIGHNGHIAWGVTSSYVDTEDLVIERLDPEHRGRYLTPEGSKPFTVRDETIQVRFGRDVHVKVRETRNGPVLDDALAQQFRPSLKKGHVLALRAPWLQPDDTTAEAIFGINRAKNWDEFGQALAKFVGPVQNFVYADVDGNIGYYVPGHIPARRDDGGGLPIPGWTEASAKVGYIPFAKLPQAFNPPRGYIVNANNRIAGAEYPYYLSRHWGDHYRATRIEQLLKQTGKQNSETTAAIQDDTVSLMARDMLALMMPPVLEHPPAQHNAGTALSMLKAWDGVMDRDRPEPLIFTAWFAALNRRLYGDDLGDWGARFIALRPDVVKSILTRHREWCDDITTRKAETCPEMISLALTDALDWIEARYGPDAWNWRWGAAHHADMRHRLFSALPLIGDFGSLSIEADGGARTINKTDMNIRDSRHPFAGRHGAGVRAIFTLADLDGSRFILSTGPAGHPLSRFYDNMLEDWRDGHYVRFARDQQDAGRGASGIILLRPRP
jgi:penicillin amidase